MSEQRRRRRAVAAAVAVATEYGLVSEDPVVLGDVSNVLVHLRPHPVVARVADRTAHLRADGGLTTFTREIDLLRHLDGRQAPPPVEAVPAGPHLVDGTAVSFLTHIDHRPGGFDPEQVGRSLRTLHEALADYPGELPELGLLTETGELLETLEPDLDVPAPRLAELRALHREYTTELAAHRAAFRPLHGDAHLGNLLRGATGLRWIDFEDAFRGPVEWDLACATASARVFEHGEGRLTPEDADRLLRCYDVDPADPLLVAMERARNLVVAAWGLLAYRGDRERLKRPYARVRWLLTQ